MIDKHKENVLSRDSPSFVKKESSADEILSKISCSATLKYEISQVFYSFSLEDDKLFSLNLDVFKTLQKVDYNLKEPSAQAGMVFLSFTFACFGARLTAKEASYLINEFLNNYRVEDKTEWIKTVKEFFKSIKKYKSVIDKRTLPAILRAYLSRPHILPLLLKHFDNALNSGKTITPSVFSEFCELFSKSPESADTFLDLIISKLNSFE